MTTGLLTAVPVRTMRTWELTMDAELTHGSAPVTGPRARAVADLLARIHGVGSVSVQPHCGGRFLLASLVVEADDLSDAIDRAAAFLRGSAAAAGIAPLILVAARNSG